MLALGLRSQATRGGRWVRGAESREGSGAGCPVPPASFLLSMAEQPCLDLGSRRKYLGFAPGEAPGPGNEGGQHSTLLLSWGFPRTPAHPLPFHTGGEKSSCPMVRPKNTG